MTRRFLLGVDLAKSFDFTSFAVIEMEYKAHIKDYVYHLVDLDRVRGVDYPKINEVILSTVAHLEKERTPDTEDGPHLCIDALDWVPRLRLLEACPLFTSSKQISPDLRAAKGTLRLCDSKLQHIQVSHHWKFQSIDANHRFDYAPDHKALP